MYYYILLIKLRYDEIKYATKCLFFTYLPSAFNVNSSNNNNYNKYTILYCHQDYKSPSKKGVFYNNI